MKVVIHILPRSEHQAQHADALMQGLKRCGVAASLGQHNVITPGESVSVVWSWKQHRLINEVKRRGGHVLVMERGFFQPRRGYCSLQVDGFNGYATYRSAPDDGERFRSLFGGLLQPWKSEPPRPLRALLIGQVQGDSALYGMDLNNWARRTAEALMRQRYLVTYRPHPLMVKHGRAMAIRGVPMSRMPDIEADLRDHDLVVTYNSTAAVDAVMAGVPTVTLNEGSIAHPVTAHAIPDPDSALHRPARDEWCKDMAWRHWSLHELASGDAWQFVRPLLD